MGEETSMKERRLLDLIVTAMFYCSFVTTTVLYILALINGSDNDFISALISVIIFGISAILYGTGVGL